jgi:nitrite reductase/ring-hydroxylating ferredoxin subunit
MTGGIQHFCASAIFDDGTQLNKTTESALPASWYTSQEMYQFERRAIFSKRWLFASHKSRLAQTGDWLRYSFASYDIIIIRDRQGNINTFHNVCRHRAYPVIEKEGSGNNKILACRYHGWSYGLSGKLAKAPGYQEMNFDKDQNSLFRCHTKIDSNGFIWINLDAKVTPEVSWEDHFDNVDVQNQHSKFNFDDYTFSHEHKVEDGKYNWKNRSANSTPEQIRKDLNVESTYYFPNASSTVSAKFITIQKVLPQGPNKATIHYEIYRHKSCSDNDFKKIRDAYEYAAKEQQADQSALLFFQNTVRDCITEHYKREKAAGKEIWPGRPAGMGDGDRADDDEEICAGLACGTQKEVLAW